MQSPKPDGEARVRLLRTAMFVGFGLFGGAVLGGVCGLFLYANSQNPEVHDSLYAVIQIGGVLLGGIVGYFIGTGSQTQQEMVDGSQRSGGTLLKKYRMRQGAGASGASNVGQRDMSARGGLVERNDAGEEYLKKILNGKS
ncbi:MAG: hypothetical protein ACR2KS_10905 [Candidatus Eremiobacter antarcticus]|nr:hypothetical protein [Candidatus Eremiobacteraeota bacterium]MBC5807540.1 hypothetical protein [Candidatus Eremiobacteraeota bacterium]